MLGVTIPESKFLLMEETDIRTILEQQPEWNEEHTIAWRAQQKPARDYQKDIIARLFNSKITNHYDAIQYGALSHDPEKFPLYYLKSKNWDTAKPSLLVEGGVHGYEPSGIFAAIEWAEKHSHPLLEHFNFVVLPCMSPWGYEHDHRWNYHAQDPNRGHVPNSDIEECQLFMKAIEDLNIKFNASIDLHETPDRDRTLRIMRASRFGSALSPNYMDIPQGFYLFVDEDYKKTNPQYSEIIVQEIEKVASISSDELIMDLPNEGGIVYASFGGLGATWLGENGYSKYAATTEVYSTPIGKKKSTESQIACIQGLCRAVKPVLSPSSNSSP